MCELANFVFRLLSLHCTFSHPFLFLLHDFYSLFVVVTDGRTTETRETNKEACRFVTLQHWLYEGYFKYCTVAVDAVESHYDSLEVSSKS